jgi:hypothetical protein
MKGPKTMAGEIRIVFPEGSGIEDLLVPMAEIEPRPELYGPEGVDTRIQEVRVGDWTMEQEVLADGTFAPEQGETDGNLDYSREAISAWATWWSWLQSQRKHQG